MANVTYIAPVRDNGALHKIRCAAYCRVSSSSEDQLHSYAAQVKFYGEKFNDSDTEELVDIYADEGITGTSAEKRDEFQRLIKDCKRGKIEPFTSYRIQSNERGLQRVAPSNESYGQNKALRQLRQSALFC